MKYVLLGLLLLTIAGGVFAQKHPIGEAPKWERYAGSKGISILLPRKPVVINYQFLCSEIETFRYSAYTNGAVYQMEIDSKDSSNVYSTCLKTARLNESTYAGRVKELKNLKDKVSEAEVEHNGYSGWKISGKGEVRWIFGDLKNKRWVELAIHHWSHAKFDEKSFLESLDLSGKLDGMEIGDGAKSAIGDVLDDEPEVIEMGTDEQKIPDFEKMRIIAKPRASYTDQARKNGTQGSVTLKVTFLANGGVGSISVVKALPNGLSEQALSAARKMVFLPATKNGKPVTVIKTVQYGFTIY